MHELWSMAMTGNKDADVDTQDGDDDAEQNECRDFADETNADQNRNEHKDEQTGAIDTIVVEGICRHRERTENRRLWHHELLHKEHINEIHYLGVN